MQSYAAHFNRLRGILFEGGRVATVSTADDILSVRSHDLVEIRGTIRGDGVLKLLESVEELAGAAETLSKVSFIDTALQTGLDQLIASMEQSAQDAAALRTAVSLRARLSSPEPRSERSPAAQVVEQLAVLARSFAELQRAQPVVDVTLFSAGDPSLVSVVSLTTALLEPDALALMDGGEFLVLGKVTRVLSKPDEDLIVLLRRSPFRHLPAPAIIQAFTYLAQQSAVTLDLPQLVVGAPGLQVIPVAVSPKVRPAIAAMTPPFPEDQQRDNLSYGLGAAHYAAYLTLVDLAFRADGQGDFVDNIVARLTEISGTMVSCNEA